MLIDLNFFHLENYLPLVFIMDKDKLRHPNRIIKATFDENQDFTGNTQFSEDNVNNQIFFCPAESDEQSKQIDKYNELIEKSSSRMKKLFGDKKASKNCLFAKSFKGEDTLRCVKDAMPTIRLVTRNKLGEEGIQYCGPKKSGVLYKFVYEVSTHLMVSSFK